MEEFTSVLWFKSSFSGGGGCVEEESHRHHNWERATASAALAGAYFAAYAAISSTPEKLTEISCPACVSAPCACDPAGRN